MIIEALDTLWTLGWALAAWVLVFALVGTVIIFAAIAAGAWATRALWRTAAGPSWRRSRLRARILAKRRGKHTEPHDYREAA